MQLVIVERTAAARCRPAGAPAVRRDSPGDRRRDVPVQHPREAGAAARRTARPRHAGDGAQGAADPGVRPAARPAAVPAGRTVRDDAARPAAGRPVRHRRRRMPVRRGRPAAGDDDDPARAAATGPRSCCGTSAPATAPDSHHWATLRAANLIWMLGRPRRRRRRSSKRWPRAGESAAELAARLAIEACVDAVLGRCVAAEAKAKRGTGVRRAVGLPRDDGVARADDVARRAGPGRACPRSSPARDRAGHHILRVVAHAVLVRRRVRPGLPADRPHRRLCAERRRTRRLGTRCARARTCQPGVAAGHTPSWCAATSATRSNCCTRRSPGAEKHGVTSGLRAASCFALAEAHAKLGEAAPRGCARGGAPVRAGRLRVHADRPLAGHRMDPGRRR